MWLLLYICNKIIHSSPFINFYLFSFLFRFDSDLSSIIYYLYSYNNSQERSKKHDSVAKSFSRFLKFSYVCYFDS